MIKIPGSKNIYVIDKNTIYIKGNYIRFFRRNGKFRCNNLSIEGLKIEKKSYEGLTLTIDPNKKDWRISEIEDHKEFFLLNELGFKKFKLYID